MKAVTCNLVKNGRFFSSEKLTKAEREIYNLALLRSGISPKSKMCYYNAQMIVLNDSTGMLKYCEGYASNLIVCSHAWITINDKVIDPTWLDKDNKPVLGIIPEEVEYFGMNFNEEYIYEVHNTGLASSIIFSEINFKNINNGSKRNTN